MLGGRFSLLGLLRLGGLSVSDPTDIIPVVDTSAGSVFDAGVFDHDVFDTDGSSSIVVVEPGVDQPEIITEIEYSYRFRLQMKFVIDPQVLPADVPWTDVSDDWGPGSEPLRCFRGTKDSGPKVNIADSGTMSFTLRNDDQNSVGIAGYYSPNHPRVRDGFRRGMEVQLIVDFQQQMFPIWTGRLEVIDPDSGQYMNRRTRCVATDAMNRLSTVDILEVAPQFDQDENQLIHTMFAAMEPEDRPFFALDAGLDVFPYAFYDLGDGLKARTLLNKILASSRGFGYVEADGAFRYQNRMQRAVQASRYHYDNTMVRVSAPTSFDTVYNRARITFKPKRETPLVIDLFFQSTTIEIEPGATYEVFFDYRDPDNVDRVIGGFDFINPTVGGHPSLEPVLDYTANTASDFTGTDITNDLDVTAYFFASAAKITIVNTNAAKAYIPAIRGRGRGVFESPPITKTATIPQYYGIQPIDIALDYQIDATVTQDFATEVVAAYADISHQIDEVEIIPEGTGPLIQEALETNVGDVITVSEAQQGLTAINGYVQGKELTIIEGKLMSVVYYLAPRLAKDSVNLEELFCVDAFELQIAVPENRIGFAVVGFSEIS